MPDFSLVGDPGRKNGEKKLKQLLLRTAEWTNSETRTRLAQRCDAEGLPSLAKVLRREATSAALRKEDFLYAAHAWRYACDIWQPRRLVGKGQARGKGEEGGGGGGARAAGVAAGVAAEAGMMNCASDACAPLARPPAEGEEAAEGNRRRA